MDSGIHKEIASAAVNLHRGTFWEDLVRVTWTILGVYAAFVFISILFVSLSRP